MRILSIGGTDFVQAWRNMGHQVLTMGKGIGRDVRLEHPLGLRELMEILASQNFRPDLTVWVDRCRPLEHREFFAAAARNAWLEADKSQSECAVSAI